MSQARTSPTPSQADGTNCVETYSQIIGDNVFGLLRLRPFIVVVLTIWVVSIFILQIFSYGDYTVRWAIRLLCILVAIILIFFFWFVTDWLKPSMSKLSIKMMERIKQVAPKKEQVALLRQIAETHQSAADWRGNSINFLLLGGIAALAFCLPAFWETEAAFQSWQAQKFDGWYLVLFIALSGSILLVSVFILRFAVDEPINRAFILACHSIEYEYERKTAADALQQKPKSSWLERFLDCLSAEK